MPNGSCANASFPMPLANLAALLAVADRLDLLELDYAFVGGAIVNLLLDDPQFSPTRPTDDLDVIDGRESIVEETALAPLPIRAMVTNAVRALLAQPAFDESLPGHLPSDASSQARLPELRQKLRSLAQIHEL